MSFYVCDACINKKKIKWFPVLSALRGGGKTNYQSIDSQIHAIKKPGVFSKFVTTDQVEIATLKTAMSNFDHDLCWFCKTNKKGVLSSITKEMRREESRAWNIGTMSFTMSYKTITIPRCENCKQIHDYKSEHQTSPPEFFSEFDLKQVA